jgi:nucleotide-binding universal stress UspA family protein
MTGLTKRKIIVPIDFSDDSFAALETALEIAEQPSAVHIVHVLPDLSPAEPGVIWNEIDAGQRTEHATDALKKRLTDDKYREIEIDIEFGDPAYRLTDCAERLGADLIVISSHGRSGFKRLLLGSVVERVVRLAHCPVLVLRK